VGTGFFKLAVKPNSDPQKIGVLLIHMSVAMSILALTAIRFIVRLWMTSPADVATGYPVLDRVAALAHYGFYVLVSSMAATTLATAMLAGLNRTVFQGSGEPLPRVSRHIRPSWRFCLALLLASLSCGAR
jgi:cytochrome b561